jgi:hypothetical protein
MYESRPLNLGSMVNDDFADFDGFNIGYIANYTLIANDGKLKATSKKFAVS